MWHQTIEDMQIDLDANFTHHNTKQPHQGRAMTGRLPHGASTDGLPKEEKARMKPKPNSAKSKQPGAAAVR